MTRQIGDLVVITIAFLLSCQTSIAQELPSSILPDEPSSSIVEEPSSSNLPDQPSSSIVDEPSSSNLPIEPSSSIVEETSSSNLPHEPSSSIVKEPSSSNLPDEHSSSIVEETSSSISLGQRSTSSFDISSPSTIQSLRPSSYSVIYTSTPMVTSIDSPATRVVPTLSSLIMSTTVASTTPNGRPNQQTTTGIGSGGAGGSQTGSEGREPALQWIWVALGCLLFVCGIVIVVFVIRKCVLETRMYRRYFRRCRARELKHNPFYMNMLVWRPTHERTRSFYHQHEHTY